MTQLATALINAILTQLPDLMPHILSGGLDTSQVDISAGQGPSCLCINNVSEETIHALTTESLRSRFRQAVKTAIRTLGNTNGIASVLLVSRETGIQYRLMIESPAFLGVINMQSISGYVQDVLRLPESTCIVDMASNRIIAGSERFAALCGFRNPLDPWGLSTNSTWIPAAYNALHKRLNAMPLDAPLGTPEEPYVYRSKSLSDTIKAMEETGMDEAEAVANARIVEISAVFSRGLVQGRLCRISTQYRIEFL